MRKDKKLSNIDDQQLVKLYLQSKNKKFLNILLQRYRGYLKFIIGQIIKDPDVTNDVLQEVLLKIAINLAPDKYKERSKFKSWITRIARNAATDYYRKNKNKKEIPESELIHPEGEDNSLKNEKEPLFASSEAPLLSEEEKRIIREFINKLPPPQKQVIILRFFSNLKFEEIARRTGENLNTVLGRHRYALQRLGRSLLTVKALSQSIKRYRKPNKPNLHDS